MGVITLNNHIRRAIEWEAKDDVYIGLGGQTPWDYEPGGVVEVPTPVPSDTIDDIFVYGHIINKFLVYPDTNGELSYKGYKFSISSPEDAYTNAARWVYTSFEFKYEEAPLKTYRSVGIYSGLILGSSTVVKSIYVPEEFKTKAF